MAVKQGMMMPVRAGVQREDLAEAYMCGTCHGVYFARPSDPYYGETPEESASEVTCSLCDENAPLSKRYWTGLTTLAWAYLENGGSAWEQKASDFGFPSFDEVFIDRSCFDGGSRFRFTYEGADVTAETTTIGWFPPVPFWDSFANVLDGGGDRFAPRVLALELVNRVRHDLKLKYGEGSEPETLSVQHAGAEGGEA